jgi:predicted membrane-bound spermidine synthase
MGLFFIPAFLLGIVSPYVIKIQSLTNPSEQIGTVVGETFFWGTFGSIFGSLATGFIFIPHLGVTRTILVVSATLMLLGILTPIYTGCKYNKNKIISFVVASLVLGGLSIFVNKTDATVVYSAEGLYSNLKVSYMTLGRSPVHLLSRDANQSSAIYLNSKKLVFPNLNFTLLYDDLIEDPQDVLILGGGAYNVPRTLTHLNPEISIDVAEIEPKLFSIAQEYFDLDDTSKINNHITDARVFLRENASKRYDFIFSDIFNTNLAPPFHVTTREFYSLAKNNLSPNGVLMINTIGEITKNHPSLTGSTIKTILSVFPNTIAYRHHENPEGLQNIPFIIRNGDEPLQINSLKLGNLVGRVHRVHLDEFDLSKEIILTDDHAPVEYLIAKRD